MRRWHQSGPFRHSGANQQLHLTGPVLGALTDESLEDHERDTRAATALTQAGFGDPDRAADVLSADQ
jgi:hypothetical protein